MPKPSWSQFYLITDYPDTLSSLAPLHMAISCIYTRHVLPVYSDKLFSFPLIPIALDVFLHCIQFTQLCRVAKVVCFPYTTLNLILSYLTWYDTHGNALEVDSIALLTIYMPLFWFYTCASCLIAGWHCDIRIVTPVPVVCNREEYVQYIPRNMHTVLLCFALLWLCNRS